MLVDGVRRGRGRHGRVLAQQAMSVTDAAYSITDSLRKATDLTTEVAQSIQRERSVVDATRTVNAALGDRLISSVEAEAVEGVLDKILRARQAQTRALQKEYNDVQEAIKEAVNLHNRAAKLQQHDLFWEETEEAEIVGRRRAARA